MNRPLLLAAVGVLTTFAGLASSSAAEDQIKVMIIGGQNNHNWAKSTPFMQQLLDRGEHFDVTVDKKAKRIVQVAATRDACCGCAHFAAEKLVGAPIADSLEQVGLHNHHYPCQASMGIDPLYGDTLMHISGNIMKDALREALGDDFEVPYVRPAGYVEE